MIKDEIIIIGFGGHARSIADSIKSTGDYNIVGYTDIVDRRCQYNYLGTDDNLKKIFDEGIPNAVIGIGFVDDYTIRDNVIDKAKEIGFSFPTIIDTSAVIADDCFIGDGCFIGKNTVINAATVIDEFSIINTGAIIEHDNKIGAYSHIAVGALLCGEVSVGHHTLIGAGSTVIQCKNIGNNCIIGAGSLVIANVENNMKVYGVIK